MGLLKFWETKRNKDRQKSQPNSKLPSWDNIENYIKNDIENDNTISEDVKNSIINFSNARENFQKQYQNYLRNFVNNKKIKKETLKNLENYLNNKLRDYSLNPKNYNFETLRGEFDTSLSGAVINKEERESLVNSLVDFLKAKAEYEKSRLNVVNIFLKGRGLGNLEEQLRLKDLTGEERKAKIFQIFFLNEKEELNKLAVESWPPQRKSVFRKALDWWLKQKPTTRLAISTLMVTGLSFGLAGLTPTAALTMAGFRFARGIGGMLLSGVTGKVVESILGKRLVEKERKSMEAVVEEEFSRKVNEEGKKKNLTLKDILEINDRVDSAFEKIKSQKRKVVLAKAAAMMAGSFVGVGMSESFLGMLERAWNAPPFISMPRVSMEEIGTPPAETQTLERGPLDVSGEDIRGNVEGLTVEHHGQATTASMIESGILQNKEVLQIGFRGPEGAIIDYFRNNPEAAIRFGCPDDIVKDGQIINKQAFEQWIGRKAHLLWLEHAKEALKDPQVLEEMKKLGYSQDINGYLKMMKRIGKGYVEINLEEGKINLVDMEYLKSRRIFTEHISSRDIPGGQKTPPIKVLTEVPTEKQLSYDWEIMPGLLPAEKWNLFDGLMKQIIAEGGVKDKHFKILVNYYIEGKLQSGDFAKYFSYRAFNAEEVKNHIEYLERILVKNNTTNYWDDEVKEFVSENIFPKSKPDPKELTFYNPRILNHHLKKIFEIDLKIILNHLTQGQAN